MHSTQTDDLLLFIQIYADQELMVTMEVVPTSAQDYLALFYAAC